MGTRKHSGPTAHANYYTYPLERRLGHQLLTTKERLKAADADWMALSSRKKDWWAKEAVRLQLDEPPRVPYTNTFGSARAPGGGARPPPRPVTSALDALKLSTPKRQLNQVLSRQDHLNHLSIRSHEVESKAARDSGIMTARLHNFDFTREQLLEWIASRVFTVAHTVPYFSLEGQRTAPAEIALVQFTLRHGYTNARHWIIDPGDDFAHDTRLTRLAAKNCAPVCFSSECHHSKHSVPFTVDAVQRDQQFYTTDMHKLLHDFLDVINACSPDVMPATLFIYPSKSTYNDMQQSLDWVRMRRDYQISTHRLTSSVAQPSVDLESVRYVNGLLTALRSPMTTLIGNNDGVRRYQQLYQESLHDIVSSAAARRATALCPFHSRHHPTEQTHCALSVAFSLTHLLARNLEHLWPCVDTTGPAFKPQRLLDDTLDDAADHLDADGDHKADTTIASDQLNATPSHVATTCQVNPLAEVERSQLPVTTLTQNAKTATTNLNAPDKVDA